MRVPCTAHKVHAQSGEAKMKALERQFAKERKKATKDAGDESGRFRTSRRVPSLRVCSAVPGLLGPSIPGLSRTGTTAEHLTAASVSLLCCLALPSGAVAWHGQFTQRAFHCRQDQAPTWKRVVCLYAAGVSPLTHAERDLHHQRQRRQGPGLHFEALLPPFYLQGYGSKEQRGPSLHLAGRWQVGSEQPGRALWTLRGWAYGRKRLLHLGTTSSSACMQLEAPAMQTL